MRIDSEALMKKEQFKFDRDGLLAAVIQDHRNGAVLMVGYMDYEALNRTVEAKKVCFWSRSRQEYWVKGETSGNVFHLVSIYYDCDADALLVNVLPGGAGKACHTGNYSCFYNLLHEEKANALTESGCKVKHMHEPETGRED